MNIEENPQETYIANYVRKPQNLESEKKERKYQLLWLKFEMFDIYDVYMYVL